MREISFLLAGTPEDSGISLDVVRQLAGQVPIFGVCMGLQCIGQAFGGTPTCYYALNLCSPAAECERVGAWAGRIVRAPGGVMHGKTSEVFHNQLQGDGLLGGLPRFVLLPKLWMSAWQMLIPPPPSTLGCANSPFVACRYHSLVIERETFPNDQLEVTAWTANGLVMGVRHRQHRFLEVRQQLCRTQALFGCS